MMRRDFEILPGFQKTAEARRRALKNSVARHCFVRACGTGSGEYIDHVGAGDEAELPARDARTLGRLPSERVERAPEPKKPGSDRVRGALRASIVAAEPAAAAAALAVSRETDSLASFMAETPRRARGSGREIRRRRYAARPRSARVHAATLIHLMHHRRSPMSKYVAGEDSTLPVTRHIRSRRIQQ